jgi:hypothetical protein
MTSAQLYLVICVPIMANAVMYGLLCVRFKNIDRRFDARNWRFDAVRPSGG